MSDGEQFKEPKDIIDEIVAAVSRYGKLRPTSPALEKLEPWLRILGTDKPYQVTTVMMPHDWFLSLLNDGALLEHVRLKPWEEITDDMRVRHARLRVQEFVESRADAEDDYLAFQEIRARNGKFAVVAFICADGESPPSIERFLGVWPTLANFWSDQEGKYIDPDLLPSDEEILRLWEHFKP